MDIPSPFFFCCWNFFQSFTRCLLYYYITGPSMLFSEQITRSRTVHKRNESNLSLLLVGGKYVVITVSA